MLPLFLALAFAAQPVSFARTAECDVLEVSHYYSTDTADEPLLSQVIAWSWMPEKGRHELRDWRMVKSQQDRPKQVGDHWEANWGPSKVVVAPHFKESWWNFDIEVVDRRVTPREERIPLFPKKADVRKPGNDPMPPGPEER